MSSCPESRRAQGGEPAVVCMETFSHTQSFPDIRLPRCLCVPHSPSQPLFWPLSLIWHPEHTPKDSWEYPSLPSQGIQTSSKPHGPNGSSGPRTRMCSLCLPRTAHMSHTRVNFDLDSMAFLLPVALPAFLPSSCPSLLTWVPPWACLMARPGPVTKSNPGVATVDTPISYQNVIQPPVSSTRFQK